MTYIEEKKNQSIENNLESAHILELANRDIKKHILYVLYSSCILCFLLSRDIKKKKKNQVKLLEVKHYNMQ